MVVKKTKLKKQNKEEKKRNANMKTTIQTLIEYFDIQEKTSLKRSIEQVKIKALMV